MFDDIFVSLASVFAAQGPAESDFCISARYVCSMFEAYVRWSSFFRRTFSLHRGKPRAMFAFQGVCVVIAKSQTSNLKP